LAPALPVQFVERVGDEFYPAMVSVFRYDHALCDIIGPRTLWNLVVCRVELLGGQFAFDDGCCVETDRRENAFARIRSVAFVAVGSAANATAEIRLFSTRLPEEDLGGKESFEMLLVRIGRNRLARVEFGRVNIEPEQRWWRVVAIVVVEGVLDHVLGEADQGTVPVLEPPERISVNLRSEVAHRPVKVAIEVAEIRRIGSANDRLRAEHHVAVGCIRLVDRLVVTVGEPVFVESEFEIAAIHLLGQSERTGLVERRIDDGVVVARDLRTGFHETVIERRSVWVRYNSGRALVATTSPPYSLPSRCRFVSGSLGPHVEGHYLHDRSVRRLIDRTNRAAPSAPT